MNVNEIVLDILNGITETDFSKDMDEDIFTSGLVDSMATVALLLELQEKFGIDVPISEFNRDDWNTANKIIQRVESLQWV